MTPGFSAPSGWGWVEGRDEWSRPLVFVARLPAGPVSVLPEMSALIWLSAVEGDGDVTDHVAEMTGHTADAIRADVEAFIDDLVARGLLERL